MLFCIEAFLRNADFAIARRQYKVEFCNEVIKLRVIFHIK